MVAFKSITKKLTVLFGFCFVFAVFLILAGFDTSEHFWSQSVKYKTSCIRKASDEEMLVYNETDMTYRLVADLDMKFLTKQRLKPMPGLTVLDGLICPGTETTEFIPQKRTMFRFPFISLSNFRKSKKQVKTCPNFVKCSKEATETEAGVFKNFAYCNVEGVDDTETITYKAPKSLDEHYISGLDFITQSPPYKGQIFAVTEGVFVNALGHVFTRKYQYMRGGCQDFVDDNHGGERRYSVNDVKLNIHNLELAINLIHFYGENYYHFFIEVMPRFYMVKELLKLYPSIPILIREAKHLHLLQYIGIENWKELNFVFVNEEKDLIYVSHVLFTPLATRCLHPSPSAFNLVRQEISKFLSAKFSNPFPLSIKELIQLNSNVVKIIYLSRANTPTRRHVLEEHELLLRIRRKLKLDLLSEAPLGYQFDGTENTLNFEEGDSPVQTFISSNPFNGIYFSLSILYGNETFLTAMKTLMGASIVIGPHGASFSNLMFVPSSAFVLEFKPNGYYDPCFIFLCNVLKQRHYAVNAAIGHQNSPLSIESKEKSQESISIDRIVEWVNDKSLYLVSRLISLRNKVSE